MSKLRRVNRALVADVKNLGDTMTCPDVASSLGKSPRLYRAIAVTDGSGTSWGSPAGSAAYLYLRETEEHTLLFSRVASGTSQSAELRAILDVLEHLHGLGYHKRDSGCRILFITDSTLVESTLKAIDKDYVKLYRDAAHPGVAAAILAFARRGFGFDVARIRRNTSPVHAGVDEASRSSRLGKDPVEAYRCASEKQIKRKRKSDGEGSSEDAGRDTKDPGSVGSEQGKLKALRRVGKVSRRNAADPGGSNHQTVED